MGIMESEFWGAVIPPAKTVKVEVDESGEFVLVTQVALGGDAKPGRCALAIRVGGEAEKVLCTLDKGKCDQVGLDVIVDATFELRNHGPCALHLSGLRQMDGIDEAAEEDEKFNAIPSEFGPISASGRSRNSATMRLYVPE